MITVDEIKKIADLAKFSLENDNLEKLAVEMSDILEFAKIVSSTELTAMEDTDENDQVPLRDDIVVPSMPQEKILQNAREVNDGYFVARG